MFRRRVVLLLLLYVASYLALSRLAFREARQCGSKGFYFFTPQDTTLWRASNYACVVLYYPLIVLDDRVGTGMRPAAEPLWGLSK